MQSLTASFAPDSEPITPPLHPEKAEISVPPVDSKDKAEKKPKKVNAKITKYLVRCSDDNTNKLIEDQVEEIKRLEKELDTVRGVDAAIKRECDEFRRQMLEDRLKNLKI